MGSTAFGAFFDPEKFTTILFFEDSFAVVFFRGDLLTADSLSFLCFFFSARFFLSSSSAL
jgi:hypothetical protein